MQQEQWGSRVGFILAAVGSAIGLGNIWRFPYMAFDNGGGAFLIPYFVALLTAGIPIIIMEFALGHKMKGGGPLTFARINRKFEWIGWWQGIISFVIAVYYVVIIGWAINYIVFSFSLTWSGEPVDFFVGEFLALSDGPFDLGGIRRPILAAVVVTWGISFVALYAGVQEGIERANKVFMPLLIVMLLIILVRGITLPGAADGLELLFKPDFSQILDGGVWVAAYGQIFFTLSIAFAIMITYSSYLPDDADIVNNGFMTALLNSGFSILAGIAIFSIVGYMMHLADGELPGDLSGVFLAFATIPAAINELPTMSVLVGVLFFLALTFAGLSSFISINEVVVRAFVDKLNTPRKKVVVWYTIIAGLVSVIFTTGAGLYILDIVDYFINNFGIAIAGLVEVIVVGYLFRLSDLRDHANATSDFSIGSWWNIMIKVVTPVILGISLILNFVENFSENYGGYATVEVVILGWLVAALAVIIGFAVARTKWPDETVLSGPDGRA
ncbi:MAG: sodium-dependent transporter [Alkalispirochaeta sp.]